MKPLRVAVVGAGWAGIAAAVHARRGGHDVEVFEMAPRPGGRARSVAIDGFTLDNGQHILIGAYHATLELMHIVGADKQRLLCRLPLVLHDPYGRGLQLRAGAPVPALLRAVFSLQGWTWRDRLSLMAAAARWALTRFHCEETLTVADLCRRLPRRVREQLVDPLCVAALNTPAEQASASVFLRVLHDALFTGPGAADLLLPCAPLGTLLPQPAAEWFDRHGVPLHTAARAMALRRGTTWQLDGRDFDAIVLACTANEAARLSRDIAPTWAASAAALRYEPIVTVYLQCAGARLGLPMVALPTGTNAPAQFAFDLGLLNGPAGVFAFVISGARAWVEQGLEFTASAILGQAQDSFPDGTWPVPPTVLHIAAEKRATFRCVPGLRRPPASIAPGLWAAGDYVDGPYPATLEGAVRSGKRVALALGPASP